jgi:hypothetical protein
MPAVQSAADKCRSSNLCAGNLHSVMDPTLKGLLLPAASNATALARCKANTQIYVSEGQPVISIRPGSLILGRLASVQIKGSKPELIDKSNAEVGWGYVVRYCIEPAASAVAVPCSCSTCDHYCC